MESLFNLATNLKNNRKGWDFSGPQSIEPILSVEKKYSIVLPPSFKEYVAEIGGLEGLNVYFAGIGPSYLDDPEIGIMENTLMLREDHNMPHNLFCIEYDIDLPVNPVLDLNKSDENGENPIMSYHKWKNEIIGEFTNKTYGEYMRNLLLEYAKQT